MKKLFLAIMVVILFLIAGCTKASVESEMVITSKDGAGIKTIRISVSKSDTQFFPQGYKPVVDFIQSQLPEGFMFNFSEEKTANVFTISYTFTDINDYNNKTRAMILDDQWQFERLEPATLTYKEVEGGYEISFSEKSDILHACLINYLIQLHYQSDIYENTGGSIDQQGQGGKQLDFKNAKIKIGDDETVIPLERSSEKTNPEIIAAKGLLKSDSAPPPLPEPTIWPSPSPWPSIKPPPYISKFKKFDNIDKKDYTFAVIPDIQFYSVWYYEIMNSMYDWIVENAEEENIKAVLHLGDITEVSAPLEWHRSATNIKKLNGKVPYFIAVGNHDLDTLNMNNKNYTLFNEYFAEDIKNSPHFGAAYEPDIYKNAYYTIKSGQHDYLIVSLEFQPKADAVEWANSIIENHPDHRVIFITHHYLGSDGSRAKGTWGYSGQELWDEMVSRHKNMFMVLCGHVPSDGIQVYRIDEGVHGNKVMQMLIDPQDFMRGGDGLMLLLRFSEDGNEIGFEYYSPWRDQHYGAENQFTYNYLTGEITQDVPPEATPAETTPIEPTPEETSPIEPTPVDSSPDITEPTPDSTDQTPADTVSPEDPTPIESEPDSAPETSDNSVVVFILLALGCALAIVIVDKKVRSLKRLHDFALFIQKPLT